MAGSSKISSYFNKPQVAAYIFLLPSIIILTLFSLIPLLASLVISTLNMDIFLKKISFVGMANYVKIIADDRFWNAMGNTFYFTVVEMPLQVMLALLVAAYVRKNTLFRKFLRSSFFIPAVCSMTAIGILWSMLLDPTLGMYSYLLGVIGVKGVQFLKDPVLAMPCVILTTVWKNFGLSMVILVAGIQNIPESYYEAAEIDGSSRWGQFINITVPLLVPTLSFCIITNTIDCLKVFDQVYVMTQGGPLYKTETIVQYIYYRGFKISPFNLGYASAVAEVLFIMIAVIAYYMYRLSLKKETVV